MANGGDMQAERAGRDPRREKLRGVAEALFIIGATLGLISGLIGFSGDRYALTLSGYCFAYVLIVSAWLLRDCADGRAVRRETDQ